jgi:zinc transport system permease protein
MISQLPYPFELGFMQRALVACLAVGVFAPMIGTFLVQKRLSLIGDGIGHIAFAGVGAGLLAGAGAGTAGSAGLWPLGAAMVFAVVGSLAIEWFRARRGAAGDVALAIIFYAGLALGVVFISRADGLNAGVLGYLFGQPLTVDRAEVVSILGIGVAVVAIITVLRRALFSVVSDEAWSRVAGLPVAGLNALLAVLVAIVVVAAMQVVGILLVAAMMVLPVAAAQQLARSFRSTLVGAVAVGAGSAVLGLGLARSANLAAGGTIVLVALGMFLVCMAVARLRTGRAGPTEVPAV